MHDTQEECLTDAAALAAELRSADSAVRLKALRRVCPCRMGWDAFEGCRPLVLALQKDPDPDIRRVALHVMADALQMKGEGSPTTNRQAYDNMAARRQRLRGFRGER